MELKVDYIEIDRIGNKVGTEVETLEDKRQKLLKIIEDLNGCWKGEDYDEFKANSKTYIDNLKIKFEELEYLSEFIKIASKKYSNDDDSWGNRMKQYGEENKKWEA